jgi:AraC-like DNA-binding protein
MSYRPFNPSAALQPFVKNLWVLDECQERYNREPIMPDSYVQCVVTCGAPLVWMRSDGRPVELPAVFVIGLQPAPLRLHASGHCQLVGIQCYAWAAPALLDGRGLDAGRPLLAASRAWQRLGLHLAGRLRSAGAAAAIADAQDYLERNAPFATTSALGALPDAGAQLYAADGNIAIRGLAAGAALSLSQLERQFRQAAGVAPKALARLIRFERARDALVAAPLTAQAALAHDLGYTDQSHFVRDFKQFAACTPGRFAAEVRAMA